MNHISGLCDLGLEQLRSLERGDEGERRGEQGRLWEDWGSGDDLASKNGRLLEEDVSMGTSFDLEEGLGGWEGVEGEEEEDDLIDGLEVILGDEGLLESEDLSGALDVEMGEAI